MGTVSGWAAGIILAVLFVVIWFLQINYEVRKRRQGILRYINYTEADARELIRARICTESQVWADLRVLAGLGLVMATMRGKDVVWILTSKGHTWKHLWGHKV